MSLRTALILPIAVVVLGLTSGTTHAQTTTITYPTSNDRVYANSTITVTGNITWTGTTTPYTVKCTIADNGKTQSCIGTATVTIQQGKTASFRVNCQVPNLPKSYGTVTVIPYDQSNNPFGTGAININLYFTPP